MQKYKVVLTIAGSDCSGGAGIQADIKTVSANGCYAASVITALTAQNTQGVQGIFEVSADFVAKQIDSIFNDLTVDAVKVGMLYRTDVIETVVEKLEYYQAKNIVVDPVMIAKDGSYLIEKDAINILKTNLLPIADLITPNLPEAYHLIDNRNIEKENSAKLLTEMFYTNILLKGGHDFGKQVEDIFYSYNQKFSFLFSHPRINTKNNHGTGCTLSSAIAAQLALGKDLFAAIESAENYLYQALLAGSQYQLGKGIGPVHHFHSLL